MTLGFILNKHDAFQHQPFLVKLTHASVSPVTTVQTNENFCVTLIRVFITVRVKQSVCVSLDTSSRYMSYSKYNTLVMYNRCIYN